MEALYILLPISILIALVVAVVLVVAVRTGQFDDLEGPAYRVLTDDEDAESSSPDNDRDSVSRNP